MKLSEQEIKMLINSVNTNIGVVAQTIVRRNCIIMRDKNPELQEELNRANTKDKKYFNKLNKLYSKLKGDV